MAEEFFESKKAAAIFKHAVLDKYVDPFVGKTGKTSVGGRVGIVDAYAGEGRYADGEEGSPALLMRKAGTLKAQARTVECVFVEADKDTYDHLVTVVENEADGADVVTIHGDIKDHLDHVLALRKGAPMFMFLDPFGLSLPFETVASIFEGRPGGLGTPATEVLINFTAVGLRRIAGLLYTAAPNLKTLARMDTTCGGTWWRDEWLKHAPFKHSGPAAKQSAEEAVVAGYSHRLAVRAKAGAWSAEVQNRTHHRPVYYLVFLSRHRDGLTLFGEALSLAMQEWRRVIFDIENGGTLFDSEEAFKAEEEALAASWHKEITANVRGLLHTKGAFTVVDYYPEVYGSALGKARGTHLRKVLKQLHKDDETASNSTGDLVSKKIEPGPNLQPPA